MNIGHRARLVAGVVVGLVVAGGTAYATTVDTSGTETAACITPSKYIRVLADGAECRRRETAISLPSMDTVDAITSAVNENSDTLDQATSDIADLQDTVGTNSADIADLQDATSNLDQSKAAASDLADEIARASDAEASLFDNFDNYYNMGDIDGTVAGLQEAIDSKADGEATDSNLGELANAIGDLSSTLVTMDQVDSDLQNQITDLGTTVAANSSNADAGIAGLVARADAADAFGADLAASIGGFQTQADALAAAQSSLNAQVAAFADAISNLANSVATAFATRDAAIDALTARVAALEAAVAALQPTPAP